MVPAFQTDTTRACTLKLNNDHSSLRYPHLDVGHMVHHALSHHGDEDWLKVNQCFVEQLAYIARRLDETREGDPSNANQFPRCFLIKRLHLTSFRYKLLKTTWYTK